VRELFASDSQIALFYFAGHGHIEATGGYLCASDGQTGDDGLPLSECLPWRTNRQQGTVIVLDSCHSVLLEQIQLPHIAELTEGLTILTASTADQYATEATVAGYSQHFS